MAPALELVRCACGLVRNDEDPPAPLLLDWFSRARACDPARFEQPRACRGCGAVYMLPRPTAPSSKHEPFCALHPDHEGACHDETA